MIFRYSLALFFLSILIYKKSYKTTKIKLYLFILQICFSKNNHMQSFFPTSIVLSFSCFIKLPGSEFLPFIPPQLGVKK